VTADRLFFALWPNDGLRRELMQRLPPLVQGIGGKAQRPDQWHVTLEFLGSVTSERQPAVWAAADRVVMDPIEVVFDAIEHWRKPQVVCLAASSTPAPLAAFVRALRAALVAQGFVPDAREYRPHVTLARKVRHARPARLEPALAWAAERFALVRSVTDSAGSRYEPLCWWNAVGR